MKTNVSFLRNAISALSILPLSCNALVLTFCLLGTFDLNAQVQKVEPVVQFGHLGSEITELVISSDGSLMATTDGVIVKLWDMKTGLEIRSLAEENRPGAQITNICLSADGNKVGYIFESHAVVRSTENGSFLAQYPEDDIEEPVNEKNDKKIFEDAEKSAQKYESRKLCNAIALHPRENRVALMFSDKIEIRDITTDVLIESLPTRSEKPKYVLSPDKFSFSADGLFLVSSTGSVSVSGDKTYTYKWPAFKKDTTYLDYAVRGGLLTSDGKYFVMAYSTSEKIDTIKRRLEIEWEAKLKEDSTLLDEEENIRDDSTGEVIVPLFTFLKALEIYADNFTQNGSILISEAATGNIIQRIDTSGVSSLCISPDNRTIATAHQHGYANFWDIQSGKGISQIKIEQVVQKNPFFKMPPPSPKIVFTPDSRNVVIAAKFIDEENIALYDVATGQKVRSIGADIPLVNIGINDVSGTRVDMREFVEMTNSSFFFPIRYEVDRGYRMFNLQNGKVPSSFPKHDSVAYSPYRDYYLSQKRGDYAKVFNAEFNYRISILDSSDMRLKNVCFSHDGKYVAASYLNKFMVWEVSSGKRIYSNNRHELLITDLSFDPNDRYLVSCGEDRRVGFWDISKPAEEPDGSVGPSFKNTLFAKGLRDRGKVIGDARKTIDDVNKGAPKLDRKLPFGMKNPLSKLGNDKQEKMDKTEKTLSTLEKINNKVSRIEKLLQFNGGYDISYSEDGRYAAVWLNNYSSVKVFDLGGDSRVNNKDRIKFKDKAKNFVKSPFKKGNIKEMGTIRDWYLAAFQKFIFGGRQKDQTVSPKDSAYLTYMWLNSFKRQYNLRYLSTFSPDYSRLARYQTTFSLSGEGRGLKKLRKSEVKSKKGIRIQCVGKGCEDLWLPESEGFNEGLAFGGDYIAASNRTSNTIKVWNANTGAFVKTISGHSGQLRFSPNGKVLISSGWDRQVKAIDFESGSTLYSFIGIKGSRDYVILLPNGYYTASRRNSRAVAFAKGKRAYPFEQFDLFFNRPDSLVALIGESYGRLMGGGNPNRALAEAYRAARTKRIEYSGYQKEELSPEAHLPEVNLVKVPASTPKPTLALSIKALDEQYELSQLRIYVNDVPVFGSRGLELKQRRQKMYEATHELTLVPGHNRIQVSVLNAKGAESLRETVQVTCTAPAIKPSLYLILAGASIFQDTSMNLSSPENDLKAIEAMFQLKKSDYQDIIPVRLLGKDFTLENFRKIKATELKNTTVQDHVIVAFGTHGLLDAQYNYYLATYNTNFKNPAASALPYKEIEDLLDGINARQRLVFIDACHAGEVDTLTQQHFEQATKRTPGLKFRKTFRASAWNSVGYQESFDLMKDLFIDVRRGSGATIIGSANGTEYALDGGNAGTLSVFTHALIKALQDMEADGQNNDQIITVSELQEYLGNKVHHLTGGAQRPIYRVENVGNDWRVW